MVSVEQEWRCARCRLRLGDEEDGKVEIRYRSFQYSVRGTFVISTVCRRCGKLNDLAVTDRAGPAAVERAAGSPV